jgi:hypothetical protein
VHVPKRGHRSRSVVVQVGILWKHNLKLVPRMLASSAETSLPRPGPNGFILGSTCPALPRNPGP